MKRIRDRDFRHYNTAHAVFQPRRMSREFLEAGYLWMYREFYSWSHILKRWPAARGQALAYLQFNLLYRKFGKATSLLGKHVGMRNLARLANYIAYPTLRRQRQPSVIPAAYTTT